MKKRRQWTTYSGSGKRVAPRTRTSRVSRGKEMGVPRLWVQLIVCGALFVALIGFTHAMPQVTDSLTPELFFVTMILYNGMPIAGWIISVIAMKFYPLTGKKMIEIEDQIAKLQLKQTKE